MDIQLIGEEGFIDLDMVYLTSLPFDAMVEIQRRVEVKASEGFLVEWSYDVDHRRYRIYWRRL